MRRGFIGFSVAAFLGVPLSAQWLHYPTAGIPRTTDGKPNLSAPAPKTPDSKPDFSGMWQVPNPKYLQNLAADGVDVPMLRSENVFQALDRYDPVGVRARHRATRLGVREREGFDAHGREVAGGN
jgi:hypothetical protein